MSNNNLGYVKVYRSLMNKGYYKDSEHVHLWLHILFKAAYENNEFLFNGKIHDLQPGQFITGRRALSKETGISESKVERILQTFGLEQQIEQQNLRKFRIISILNWNEYQTSEQQIEQPVNSRYSRNIKKTRKIEQQTEQQITDKNRTISVTNGNEYQTSEQQIEQPVNNQRTTSEHKEEVKEVKEVNLSSLLFEEIIKANPHSRLIAQTPKQKEATINRWAEDINKLVRIDKQNPSIIEEVIKKATGHKFWGRNIQSGDSLRRSWDKLTSEFTPSQNKKMLIIENESGKPKPVYTLSKGGQWQRIENGEQIVVDEDQVPESIRNKITGQLNQAPPAPVAHLITELMNKFNMQGAAT